MNWQLRVLLQQKSLALANQKAEMDQEITKKQNWVLNELMAEDQEVAKAIEFHDEVESFAVKAMQALKNARSLKAAAILDWKGCELDLTKSRIDNLSNLTLTENIFAQMHQAEKGESALLEIEKELAAITSKSQNRPLGSMMRSQGHPQQEEKRRKQRCFLQ